MRWHNGVREKIESGETAIGAQAATVSPALLEVYGSIGFDFVWVDFEHGGPTAADAAVFENLSRAGELADVQPLVRLPSADPVLVRKSLDAGVRTLLIPRVESASDVRQAVEASRFHYDGGTGERGSSTGRAARWGDRPDDYPEREDNTVCVGVMIENASAVDAIEEILAVPDLGFVFLGPGDLSTSLGYPLETDHPAVLDAMETVRDAALGAGVPVGRIANDVDLARRAIDEGYQLLRVGSEIAAARSVLGSRLDALVESS